MTIKLIVKTVLCGFLLGQLITHATVSMASTKVKTIALFNGKAMLSVDGKPAKIIAQGEVLQGVTLIESTTDYAVVEIAGETRTLKLNSATVIGSSLGDKQDSDSPKKVELWADENGFFRVSGKFNGRATKFLVDTGANLVVLSSAEADRMEIDYSNARESMSVTASGTVPVYVFQADKISIAGIELSNVRTGVVIGEFPVVPLLGMSFLQKLDMNRSGNLMVLTKR